MLKALANGRRLAILKYLSNEKEATVGEVAEKIGLSFKATSKHLAVLYGVDILEKEQRGLEVWYSSASHKHPIIKQISNSLE